MTRHVRELKADDAESALRQALGKSVHERRIHPSAGAVSERDGLVRILRTIDGQF